jgi:hypothetical protein
MTTGIQCDNWVIQMAHVLSGDGALALKAYPEAYSSDVADLHAAAAGTYQVKVHYQLVDADGEVQKWFHGKVTFNSTEVITDADCAAPGINGVPLNHVTDQVVHFYQGEAEITLIYDTDAGVAHDYAADDTATLTPEAFNINGVAVTLTDAVFIDTMVAPI